MDRLVVAALATWRLSSLLLYESGPFDVFLTVRSAAARTAFTAQLFSCVYCLSVWIGLACGALMLTEAWIIMLPFALSAVAIVVNRCLELQAK